MLWPDLLSSFQFGNTALVITCCSPSISRLLLERGANVNWRNKVRAPANGDYGHCSVSENFILKCPCYIRVVLCQGGNTALMFHYENAELVELLLDMGAAVNDRDKVMTW